MKVDVGVVVCIGGPRRTKTGRDIEEERVRQRHRDVDEQAKSDKKS